MVLRCCMVHLIRETEMNYPFSTKARLANDQLALLDNTIDNLLMVYTALPS